MGQAHLRDVRQMHAVSQAVPRLTIMEIAAVWTPALAGTVQWKPAYQAAWSFCTGCHRFCARAKWVPRRRWARGHGSEADSGAGGPWTAAAVRRQLDRRRGLDRPGRIHTLGQRHRTRDARLRAPCATTWRTCTASSAWISAAVVWGPRARTGGLL